MVDEVDIGPKQETGKQLKEKLPAAMAKLLGSEE